MSETVAISLQNMGKAYGFYDKPSDRLKEVLFRRTLRKEHWALSGVNIDIAPGETFGLVGENGAGKSTFLKLVAGTIRPTVGSVKLTGRVAALLELGAGFHPEETGRENVMMMGALSGVPAKEMQAYYAQVTSFSELPEAALARPVKTYSSGMFMRLAFSAATAVEPDVLIIDEALSVGDMHFQKKSLDRIMQFREAGKTVLFCSHNLYQVRSLCSRAAWIADGAVRALGSTEEVVTAYESYALEKEGLRRAEASNPSDPTAASAPITPSSSIAPVRLKDIRIETSTGINPAVLETFDNVRIVCELENRASDWPFHVGIAIVRNNKENVFVTSTQFNPNEQLLKGAGVHHVTLHLPKLALLSGDFALSVYALDDTGLQVLDMAENVRPFRIINPSRFLGITHLTHQWHIEHNSG